jgi:hypothetical protein
MNLRSIEIQQRLNFIDRTICHAAHACHCDKSVPKALKDFVHQLCLQATRVKRALSSDDATSIRESLEDLAQLSHHAQSTISPEDDVSYEVKSAVILTHLELSALKYQLG